MSLPKTSAGLLPAAILLVIGIFLLVDYYTTGGFGALTRWVAWVGGLAFIVSLVVAFVRTNKADKAVRR